MSEKLKHDGGEKLAQPQKWQKLGQTVLGAISLPTKARKERQQEALKRYEQECLEAQAENERVMREYKIQHEMNMALGDVRLEVQQIVQADEKAKRQAEYEHQNLLNRMPDEMSWWRERKQSRFQNERKQEMLERELNEKLITVDEMEAQTEVGNPEVEKRALEYDGQEIPVYDLKGLPFAMLSHSIQFQKAQPNEYHTMGAQTSKELAENPEIWKQCEDEVEMESNGGHARGNVISASYINSEHNLNTRRYRTLVELPDTWAPDICYGFEHVEGGAILVVGATDMGSGNYASKGGRLVNLADWKELEARKHYHNEVVLRRYDETGKPRLPDYIIAQNGKITEGMLKHAVSFNIPVVNIEEKFYQE